jgi:hypothetical protein
MAYQMDSTYPDHGSGFELPFPPRKEKIVVKTTVERIDKRINKRIKKESTKASQSMVLEKKRT